MRFCIFSVRALARCTRGSRASKKNRLGGIGGCRHFHRLRAVLPRQVMSRSFFKEGKNLQTLAGRYSVSRKVATPSFTVGIRRGARAWIVCVVVSIFALAFLSHVPSALATTYYVSATGRDSNSGTSTTAPFLTITKAANLTKPGDIVNVMNGTNGPFIISHSGSQSGGYVTYRAYPEQHPTVLKNGSTWDGIQL
jgi:hypothetical protein